MDGSSKARTVAFPCIENPFRVSLFCNGHYLWCLNRGGKAGARKRRAIDRDDFQLIETDNCTSVMIVNHKFGSVLSVVKNRRGKKRVRFVPQEGIQEEEEAGEDIGSQEDFGDDNESLASYQQDVSAVSSMDTLETTSSVEGMEDENDDDDEDIANGDISIECQKWQFLESLDGYVCMQNVGTGDRLGINKRGRCVLLAEDDPVGVQNFWIVEPVTGELCFLSNSTSDVRIRCDMSGRLSMSSNWKGWEVFRLLEAGNGYIKICSWTHSLWILKCHASGKVQTGRQSEFHTDQDWCSLWAVEKAPDGKGVVIRSKSFDRFLCVRNNGKAWMLGTYHPFDDVDEGTDSDCFSSGDDHTWYGGDISMSQSEDSCGVTNPSVSRSQDTFLQEAMDRRNRRERKNERRNNNTDNRRRWFGRRNNLEGTGDSLNGNTGTSLAGDSIFWHLEAAHQQVYFLSAQPSELQGTMTVGPFPTVSRNIRRTDKFRVIRKTLGGDEDTKVVAQLYHVEKEQYIACCGDGTLKLTLKEEDESTEWIMINSDTHGGNSFQSKLFGYYLSYSHVEDPLAGQTIDGDSETVVSNMESPTKSSPSKRSPSKLAGLFRGRSRDADDIVDPELVGYKELGKNGCWDLGPSVPRALNSRKVRKFALGTSLVLGSSLALPFALVGVGAVLHVGGNASVAYHVVVAGLASADTVTSVGAVGATAYFVFRAQGVSLSERATGANDSESLQNRARFQRPFCEWRNWTTPAQESS